MHVKNENASKQWRSMMLQQCLKERRWVKRQEGKEGDKAEVGKRQVQMIVELSASTQEEICPHWWPGGAKPDEQWRRALMQLMADGDPLRSTTATHHPVRRALGVSSKTAKIAKNGQFSGQSCQCSWYLVGCSGRRSLLAVTGPIHLGREYSLPPRLPQRNDKIEYLRYT